jgi:hypothetical protein
MNWRQVIDHLSTQNNDLNAGDKYIVSRHFFWEARDRGEDFTADWQFHRYWEWTRAGRIGNPPDLIHRHGLHHEMPVPPPVIQRGLYAIARDPQNVHTAAVSNQTNAALEKLIGAINPTKIMRTPDWFAARWLMKSYGRWTLTSMVVNDMYHWYNMSTCKTRNDFLYKNALDGLYLTVRKVTDREVQDELFKRTFEECYESVGMCCEGHISRLCNVLVGFDDAFVPQVPFGEILQNKMAAIYAMEIETTEKVKLATEFFNEFAVPEAERTAWLEAF